MHLILYTQPQMELGSALGNFVLVDRIEEPRGLRKMKSICSQVVFGDIAVPIRPHEHEVVCTFYICPKHRAWPRAQVRDGGMNIW